MKKRNEFLSSPPVQFLEGIAIGLILILIVFGGWYIGLKPHYDKAKTEKEQKNIYELILVEDKRQTLALERQALALEKIHDVLKQLATQPNSPKGAQ